ncbi:MAG: peptide ABC transporter substrate-binding protein [Acidobacteriota bacterium]
MVTYDEEGELEGRLARRWEHSPDYREWTYHLRTDVRWQDGVPVTAQNVKFSLELLTHPDVLEFSPEAFESITVLDDSTVTIRTSGSIDPGWDKWTVFYPKHLLEKLDPGEIDHWEFWTHPVGNGPYRFVRYLPQTMMEFEANPDYYRGKPSIQRVILKFTGAAGLTELLSGNVDVVMDVNPVLIPKVAGDPRFRAYHSMVGWWIQRAIYWQNAHPLFHDPSVRRALTLAINRRELTRVINLPENTPVVDGPYTFRQLQRGQLPEPLPYDPARALALLEAAGWRDRDGDGMRERNGQAFRFTVLVGSLQSNKQIAVFIQDQLRRVGIIMNIQMMPNLNVLAKVKAGQFEAALTAFVLGWLHRFHFGESFPLGYKNAELVKLADQVEVTVDPDAKDRVYQQLREIFRTDMPVTFLFPRMGTTFAHRRLHGLSSPWRADPVRFMEYLWLEDEN